MRKERGFPHEQFNADFEMPRAYYGGIERGEHNGATLNPQVEKKYTGRRGEDEE